MDIELLNKLIENINKDFKNKEYVLKFIQEKSLYILINVRSLKCSKEYDFILNKIKKDCEDILNKCKETLKDD